MQLQRHILLAVVILLATMLLSWHVDRSNETMHERHRLASMRLEGILRHGNELSQLLTVAVLERNALRAHRYDGVNQTLQRHLSELGELTRGLDLRTDIGELLQQRTRLAGFEAAVVGLMDEGDWAGARDALFADEHVRARRMYEIDVDTAVASMDDELSALGDRHAAMRRAALALRLASLAWLLWVGARYSRRLREEVVNQERLGAQVREANEALEQKVRQRTLELEAANQRLETLSNTDALTGLANRRAFEVAWDREWRRAARQRQPLAVLMLDLDHFKDFNDHYGHAAGDECLRRVAAVFAASARRAGEVAARYGGEEFVIVLPGMGAADAMAEAQRLLQAVRALDIPHAVSATASCVTTSVGVAARVPQPQEATHALLHEADEALYEAKRDGRDRARLAASAEPAAPGRG